MTKLLEPIDEDEARWILEVPLQWTFYLDDVEEFVGLSSSELERLHTKWSHETWLRMVRALAWAVQNPKVDLRSILPNLEPSNDALHRFVAVLHRQFTEHSRVVKPGGSRG